MAKNITRLNAGQAPSLLQADKGNELIDGINNLRHSKSTANANATGFTLKVNAEGALELDVTEATANAIQASNQANTAGAIGTGYVDLVTVKNGNYVAYRFVIA